MSVNSKAGFFTLNTSTGNQSITGLGFQPKFIIFTCSKRTADSTADHASMAVGFAISSTERKCFCFDSEDGSGDTDCQRAWANEAGRVYSVGTSSYLYRFDFVSMDTDGFTIDILNAPGSAYRIGYLAVGGTSIQNVAVGDFDTTNSTGNQSITGIGFKPTMLFVISAGELLSAGTLDNDIKGMVGFACGTGTNDQACLTISDDDGAGSSNSNNMLRVNKFLAMLSNTGSVLNTATLNSFDTDGFTINKDDTNQDRYHYLAVNGGNWHIDSFQTQSSTGNFTVTDLTGSITAVKSVLTISGHKSPTTTPETDLLIDVGFATSSTDVFNAGAMVEDGQGTSNSFDWTTDDELYTSYTEAGIFGSFEFVNFLSNGFTLDMNDSEISWQSEVAYLCLSYVEITPNSIVSGEAFGSLSITAGNVDISVNSINSGETFGQFTITTGNINVSPNSILSGETFGNLDIDISIILNSIESGEIFGLLSVTPGNVGIILESVGSNETFGLLSILTGNVNISPDSILSSEVFGYPSITAGNVDISVNSILSGETFGIPEINLIVSPYSINSSEIFGLISDISFRIYLSGVNSNENFGLFSIVQNIEISSISSQENFGQFTITTGNINVSPNSIASSEVFGEIILSLNIELNSIVSQENFGSISLNISLFPLSIVNLNVFGLLSLVPGGVPVSLNSIASVEVLGVPSFSPGNVDISINSINSGETFGQFTITTGNINVSPNSILSGETFGNLVISAGIVYIALNSIDTQESFGYPVIARGTILIDLNSIFSSESMGNPSILAGTVYTEVMSILTGENFGLFSISHIVQANSITTGEIFGFFILSVGNVNVSPNSIVSSEVFGSLILNLLVRNLFKTQLENDYQDGFFNINEFAENTTYIHKDGYTFTLPVIYDKEMGMIDSNVDIEVLSRTPIIRCQTSNFKIEPCKGDIIIVQGIRYQIIPNESDGTGTISLRLHHEKSI